MRVINTERIYEMAIQEGFRAGKAKEMVPKILRVLGKRTGYKFSGASQKTLIPVEYTNTEGSFAGYKSLFNGGKSAIRINFSLEGGSENIVSIDYYKKPSAYPDYTIKIPPQFNIIQVIGHIVLVITGEYFDLLKENRRVMSRALQERVTHRAKVKDWLAQNENVLDQMSRRGSKDWNAFLEDYIDYLTSQNEDFSEPSLPTFQIYVRQSFKKLGDERGADEVPYVNVHQGEPETSINTNEDAEREFEREIIQNEHIKKYDYMKFLFNRIKKGDESIRGLYIYGRGGIGKSYHAIEILGDLPNTFYTKGKIKGYQGLLQMLYDHKDNEILILDDIITKEDMKNTTIENILKGALEPDPPRLIQVSRPRKKNDDEPQVQGSQMEVPASSDDDLVDFTSSAGVLGSEEEENMYNFVFNSVIIFITNYPDVPQAVADRVRALSFLFTDEQVVDIIQDALSDIDPTDVDMSIKQYILDWIKERLQHAKKTLSFRLFQQVLSTYLCAAEEFPTQWEDWAMIDMRG